MGLKVKSIAAVNFVVIIACVLMGFIGYLRAGEVFAKSLQMKASADVKALAEILNYRFAGDWHLQDGLLYKGEQQMDGADGLVDSLSNVCDGKVTIFNGDTRVATTVKDSSSKRAVGTKASQTVIDNVINQGKNFVGEAMVMGKEHYAAYMPLKDATGKTLGMLFVGVSIEEMNDMLRGLILSSTALAIVVIVLICAVVSNFFIGKMTDRLESVVAAMKNISDGNLRTADLNIKTNDEIEALSNGVNNMKAHLKKLLTKIAQCSERVAASSEELTAGAQQTSDSITVVAQNMDVLTHGTIEQADTIKILEDRIGELRGRVDELRETSKEMEQIALDSANNAINGKEKVNAAISVMKTIAEKVSSSAKVVGELGKRSDEIGQIVETISGIAGQTNLLALNAAIEAARAGEHGRGFAVVSEEVRKLAEQSADAATSIAKLIATIQQDTTSAVESIEEGNASVKEGARSITEMGAALSGIEQQSTKLTANVAKSLENLNAVDTGNEEILSAVARVKKISGKETENAESISAATQQQTATIHEVAEASKTLAELAAEMQDDVAMFKL